MPESDITLIALVSPKGGVGKTTVTANLAVALAEAGHDVLVVDLDPQNALRLHLQMRFEDAAGVAVQALNGARWADAVQIRDRGIKVLPFGQLDEEAIADFEALLVADSQWLSRGLDSLSLAPQTLVLIDTPPGSAPQIRHVLPQVNAALCVLLPEVSSLVTVSTMERWLQTYCVGRSDFVLGAYVINGVCPGQSLEDEVIAVLQQRLGNDLAPRQIQRSDVVKEALASSLSVPDYAASAAVTQNFRALAQWLVTHV